MENEKVLLTDIVWFQEGPGVRNTQYTDSGVKLLNVANLVDGKVDLSTSSRYISEEEAYGKYKHFLVDPGDFIIASSGIKVDYFDKKMGFVDETQLPLCMNTSTIRFKALDSSVLNIRYFMYYLKSFAFKEQLARQITGSAQLNFGPSHLKKMTMPLCPIRDQGKICEQLDTIYHVIETRQQQLAELDNLIKARFVEIFGIYPANPKGWETGTIRDVVSDVRYGSSRPAVDGGKYPYLRMNNITYGGELDLSDTKRIDIPDNELDKCTVRRGDVLFNRTNSKELVGKTCVYNRDDMMVLAGFVIRVRVSERILPEFLSEFLNTEFSKQMLLAMCKTAIGQANINAQEMQNIGLYLPPIELQRKFVQFKEQTDKSKVAVQKALDKAQLLLDSLMQKYFG